MYLFFSKLFKVRHNHSNSLKLSWKHFKSTATVIVLEQKIRACIATWNLPPDGHDKIDGLFRTMAREYGRAAGIEYAEVFESPWLKKNAVKYLGESAGA